MTEKLMRAEVVPACWPGEARVKVQACAVNSCESSQFKSVVALRAALKP